MDYCLPSNVFNQKFISDNKLSLIKSVIGVGMILEKF